MWPFTRKETQIPKDYIFFPLQQSAITWNEIISDSQNNIQLIKWFNELAEVQAPIMKYADAATQVIITSNIPEVDALLKKPNYYQGYGEYISQFIIYKRLLGNAIVNAFAPLTTEGRKPQSLYNLPPQYTKIKTLKSKDFRFDRIDKYIFHTGEPQKDKLIIEPDYIMHIKESNPNFVNEQYLYGLSRYASCYRNIETLSNGYDAKKNAYTNGPRLIFTGKAQGEFASANTNDEIKGVQERYKKYGMRKQDYNAFFTDMPLDVNNVSFNVNELQINEMNASDFNRLCDAQTIDARVFSDIKGSTFANKESAIYDFYNNAFKSEMESIVMDHQEFLQRWWPNLEFTIDYSKIPEINRYDEEKYASIFEDVKLGLMTRNQYFEAIGKTKISNPDFDKYFVFDGKMWNSIEPEIDNSVDNLEGSALSQEQLQSQANLRGSVGGVQGILAIQQSVQSGTTDYAAAIATLIEIYGFNNETAVSILGTPGNNTQQNGNNL